MPTDQHYGDCYYCGVTFRRLELRPYGPGGQLVCHPCGNAPEHEAETKRNMNLALETALATSGDVGILITDTGPEPLVREDFHG